MLGPDRRGQAQRARCTGGAALHTSPGPALQSLRMQRRERNETHPPVKSESWGLFTMSLGPRRLGQMAGSTEGLPPTGPCTSHTTCWDTLCTQIKPEITESPDWFRRKIINLDVSYKPGFHHKNQGLPDFSCADLGDQHRHVRRLFSYQEQTNVNAEILEFCLSPL